MSSQQQQQQQQLQLQLKIKYLKLKRINELNKNLREELSRERVTASNACLSLINYIQTTRDYALPEIWGYPPPNSNHFITNMYHNNRYNPNKHEYYNDSSNGCCSIM